LRYLQNVKEILRKAPKENGAYADVKYVQQACATACLAVLKAIDQYLLGRGWSKKEFPKSIDASRKVIQKYLSMRDGKLAKRV